MGTNHWFDQITARYTRRQTLKVAVGIALGWPLLQGRAGAGTITTGPCFTGCVWTARGQRAKAVNTCENSMISAGWLAGYSFVGLLGLGAVSSIIQAGDHCIDSAILQEKADFYDCISPNCNGFDPKQSGGPCDGCSNNCCTCSASTNGYICCVFTCDDTEHSCCPGG